MMIGRERAYAGITFVALLMGAGANYILIEQMGALGAAVATAGVLVFNNALYLATFLRAARPQRSEEHTSELQSLMRISYAVFCLKKKKKQQKNKRQKSNTYIHYHQDNNI